MEWSCVVMLWVISAMLERHATGAFPMVLPMVLPVVLRRSDSSARRLRSRIAWFDPEVETNTDPEAETVLPAIRT